MAKKEQSNNAALNPYLEARREWNERYGSYISQAKTWKVIALVCLGLAAISVLGALSVAKRPQFKPYIVEVDKLGTVRNVTMAANLKEVTPMQMKAHLKSWIIDARSIWSDPNAQKHSYRQVFGSLSNNAPSFNFVQQELRKRWEAENKEVVTVEIIGQPLSLGKNSWQMEWREIFKSARGSVVREEIWKGYITVKVDGNPTEASIMSNPLGIYIQTVDWALQSTKEL